MSAPAVLIVSTDPIIGALLGLYVEFHDYRARYPSPDQSPSEAVAQSGATIIVVDVDHRDGFSPEFVQRQRAAGRRVIAFSPKLSDGEVRDRASALQLPSFAMPIDAAAFRVILDEPHTLRPAPRSPN